MARKRVYVQVATLFWVCIAINVWNGKPPVKAITSLMAKKTTHTLLSFDVVV